MLKKIGILLLIIFVIIQFFRPQKNVSKEITSTDFLKSTTANNDIAEIITSSCYDCHSNNTKYPWYSEVAPVSWWIAHHVDEGKEELNFSEWTTFSEKRKKKKLKEMIEELDEKEMPLKTYLPMHTEARLTDQERSELITWIKSLGQ